MTLIIVAIISFLLYAFIAEQVNPFKKPISVFARRRRRLGIACSLALLVAGTIALLTSPGETAKIVVITLFLSALFSSPYIIEYLKTKRR